METKDPRFQKDAELVQEALRRLDVAEGALADARRMLSGLAGEPAVRPAPLPNVAVPPVYGAPQVMQKPRLHGQSTPRPPKEEADRESTLIRAVAVGGALITLAGVAFFVAVAIQAGLLGPRGRVVLAYLVSVALLAAAHRFKASAPPVATSALIITSLYTALATTWLTATWLGWLPLFLAAVILVALYAASGVYAWRVNGREVTGVWLAVGAAVTAVTFPWSASTLVEIAPIALMIPLMAVFAIAQRSQKIQVVAPLAALLMLGTLLFVDGHGQPWLLIVLAGALAVGLGWLGATYPIEGAERVRAFAVGALPALLVPAMAIPLHAVGPSWVAVLFALGLVAVGMRSARAEPLRDWALAALPVVVFESTHRDYLYREQVLGSPLVWRAATVVVFFALLVAFLPKLRNGWLMAPWALVTVAFTWDLSEYVLGQRSHHINVESFLVAVVLLVALVAVATIPDRLPAVREREIQVVGLLFGLYLSMLSVVGVVMRLGSAFDRETGAFLGAHALVSIAWMVLAARFMLSPNGRFTNVGAVLAIVAVVKLVFFDMAALNGIARALAFLLCGIVLLTIAVRRSKVGVGEPRPSSDAQPKGEGIE